MDETSIFINGVDDKVRVLVQWLLLLKNFLHHSMEKDVLSL